MKVEQEQVSIEDLMRAQPLNPFTRIQVRQQGAAVRQAPEGDCGGDEDDDE